MSNVPRLWVSDSTMGVWVCDITGMMPVTLGLFGSVSRLLVQPLPFLSDQRICGEVVSASYTPRGRSDWYSLVGHVGVMNSVSSTASGLGSYSSLVITVLANLYQLRGV